jgi:hypothetical protein
MNKIRFPQRPIFVLWFYDAGMNCGVFVTVDDQGGVCFGSTALTLGGISKQELSLCYTA